MCLTQPATVIEVRPDELLVGLDGRTQIVSNLFVPEARVGDDVLIGLGRALHVLTHEEADRLRELLVPITSSNLEPA